MCPSWRRQSQGAFSGWGDHSPSSSRPPVLSSLQMGSPGQKAAGPCLSLVLLVWSQGPGAQAHTFQFGPCRAEGVVFRDLWDAFRAVRDTAVRSEVPAPRGVFTCHDCGALGSLRTIFLHNPCVTSEAPRFLLAHVETEARKAWPVHGKINPASGGTREPQWGVTGNPSGPAHRAFTGCTQAPASSLT